MNTIFKKGKKAVKRNGNIMAELVSRVTFIHPEKNLLPQAIESRAKNRLNPFIISYKNHLLRKFHKKKNACRRSFKNLSC